MVAITFQQMEDASLDAISVGQFANDPPGIVNPRYGAPYPNIRKVVADLMALGVDPAGYAALSGANFTGLVRVENLDVKTGDVFISRTSQPYGYVVRPNLAGFKKLAFSVDGGGQLEEVYIHSLNTIVSGSLNVSGTLRRNGFLAWDAGNQGSGSGMDADTVDGRHASYFAREDQTLGIGQTWQTVARTSGAAYTNTTTRPITVSVMGGTVSGVGASIHVDGVQVAAAGTYGATNVVYTMQAIVPPGSSYTIVHTALLTISELR